MEYKKIKREIGDTRRSLICSVEHIYDGKK